jgi:hypothetical protein
VARWAVNQLIKSYAWCRRDVCVPHESPHCGRPHNWVASKCISSKSGRRECIGPRAGHGAVPDARPGGARDVVRGGYFTRRPNGQRNHAKSVVQLITSPLC